LCATNLFQILLHFRFIAFITEAAVIQAIPGHLGEPKAPPRLRPARRPPLSEMPDRESDAINPNAQPMPDYAFDQRIAWQGTRPQGSLVGGGSRLLPTARQTSATQVTRGTDNGHAGAGFQRRSAFGTKSTIDADAYGRISPKMAWKFPSFKKYVKNLKAALFAHAFANNAAM